MLMKLTVLPLPYSTSIFPALTHNQKRELRTVLKLRHGRCFWCGHQFTKNSKVTIDHVIPFSRGGTDTIDNLQVCCRECNHMKGHLFPDEWIERLEHVIDRLRSVSPLESF